MSRATSDGEELRSVGGSISATRRWRWCTKKHNESYRASPVAIGVTVARKRWAAGALMKEKAVLIIVYAANENYIYKRVLSA